MMISQPEIIIIFILLYLLGQLHTSVKFGRENVKNLPYDCMTCGF